MNLDTRFFSNALSEPTNHIAYQVTQHLTGIYQTQFLLATEDSDFNVAEYVKSHHCQSTLVSSPLPHIQYSWIEIEESFYQSPQQACWKIEWQNRELSLIQIRWADSSGCSTTYSWLIAETQEIAELFFATVCHWNAQVRPEEVMVFASGYWQKSEALRKAIRSTTFDNLILPANLRQELQNDLEQFFAARPLYERYRIPWKRGILLVGPPGNGKTHAIKALVNWLGKPCFYVKSLKSRHYSDHDTLKAVFDRARATTPCLLIMEDLDSLITDRNRSFFLNELDGFAANTGIVLIATTNHPERLDTAIVDRPSRFDRKYHFQLPGIDERIAYIVHWNRSLEPDLQLSEIGIAEVVDATDGFSFAYLKELFLSSLMRWINAPETGAMDRVMLAQCRFLREQMDSAPHIAPPEAMDISEDSEE